MARCQLQAHQLLDNIVEHSAGAALADVETGKLGMAAPVSFSLWFGKNN
jgi:hypothetical protein